MRPRHIVLFIAACLLVLGGICAAYEYAKPFFGPVRWVTISDFLPEIKTETPRNLCCIDSTDTPDDLIIEDSIPLTDTILVADTIVADSIIADSVAADTVIAPQPRKPEPPKPVRSAEKALDAFIAALAEADTKQVRVVHYGDSQIEEDRITATLRRNLQGLYGGGGPGLLPLQQTIPTRTVKQALYIDDIRVTSKNGPQRYMVYGPKAQQRNSDMYGPLGQVALMDTLLRKGSDTLVMHIEPFGKLTSANYFNQVRILKSDSIDINGQNKSVLALPDSTKEYTLELTGQGEVYGVSFETRTGVIVDNVPMRGGSGNVFTKINAEQLSRFYRETNTKLIILQFGGNVMPWAESEERVRSYAYSMRKQIRYLQACAPEASILFIGPSDMTTVVDGEKGTYPMLPYMDEQLARACAAEGVAYWSLYQAMGGWNSMMEWHEKGLAASDGVHFMQSGANKAGNMLWKWLEKKINK